MANKRYICQRRLMGKILYVNSSSGVSARGWGYTPRSSHAKKLTAAQAALFKSDMEYLRSPSACHSARSAEGLAGSRPRRKRRK